MVLLYELPTSGASGLQLFGRQAGARCSGRDVLGRLQDPVPYLLRRLNPGVDRVDVCTPSRARSAAENLSRTALFSCTNRVTRLGAGTAGSAATALSPPVSPGGP